MRVRKGRAKILLGKKKGTKADFKGGEEEGKCPPLPLKKKKFRPWPNGNYRKVPILGGEGKKRKTQKSEREKKVIFGQERRGLHRKKRYPQNKKKGRSREKKRLWLKQERKGSKTHQRQTGKGSV